MTLTANRNTPRRFGDIVTLGIAAAVVIYAGALVARDANGNATPGATATTLRGVGRARERYDNTGGAANALNVDIEKGIYRYKNSADADAITTANIGADCYIVDDETVALTNGGNTRSVAGKIHDVDAEGVWVDFR